MRRTLVLMLLSIFLTSPCYGAEKEKPPVVNTIHTDVKEISTPYGIKAWLLEEHSLPIISLQFTFKKAGHAYDPAGKEGLAKMATDMLSEGAGTLSGAEFKKQLEASAISMNFSEDADNFSVSIKCLSENSEEALRLLHLVLTAPTWDPVALAKSKSQLSNMLSEQMDDADSLTDISWRSQYYGNSAYAKSGYGNAASIAAITPADLQYYVKNSLTRVYLLVSAVGDISPAQLKRLLDENLADLPLAAAQVEAIAASNAKGSTVIIDKQIPQSIAMFGQRGLKRDDPDFYALYILNYIWGGGSFESRLMKAVREDKGLAYNVNSFLELSQNDGLLRGYVATKNAKIHEALAIAKAEMHRLKNNGVTESEVTDAKNYLILSFPLRMDKTDMLAELLTSMQLNQLGSDFLNKRNRYFEKVTVEDVNRVAKKLLDPEHQTIVIVGNKKEIH